ncbi:hypothetical protein [Burkholderia multivorans]|uniref:hypothetical protein n=1 Tax=Burkholderia multivorans TaxID=87883 RepID=UPI001BA1297B|nr:hypothetical protein [Burkholderia multivorans]MBR8122861.1 hypothetical protein [Burkholderia multivorans]
MAELRHTMSSHRSGEPATSERRISTQTRHYTWLSIDDGFPSMISHSRQTACERLPQCSRFHAQSVTAQPINAAAFGHPPYKDPEGRRIVL